MVPTDDLDAVSLSDVLRFEVGHGLRPSSPVAGSTRWWSRTGRTATGRCAASSASQIARQMGIPLQTTEVARTFAEIEAAIAN